MQGYIKVYRKLMNSPVWEDPNYLKLWMYCLMKATHKERETLIGNQVVDLKPGQFVTGRHSLAEDMNKGVKPRNKQSEISWWRYLNNLEKLEMLNIKKTNKYSVISIINWSQYQESEQQMNNKRTTDEQQMITNKNVKNDKNVKKKESHKQVYDESSLYFKMSNYFYSLILKNNPDHKKPNFQKWSDEFRKIVELDKKSKDEVREVMEFVQSDEFEMVNVLSPTKLRKRYDQLAMKVKRSKNNVIDFKKKEYNPSQRVVNKEDMPFG
ncbi:hypothetical protein [Paraliobacillus ryukyuensis]|uniref:hypothetical protein n=1 Tax=Paraliobacillus ryukyuensis TaxID=200904 RepID=UPI0009A5DF80|nr:hypothetical protein [Paraliobacillus ryukyuensis]